MTTSIENPNKTNGKIIAGVIILIVGSLLLINQLNLFFVPNWLFSWPMGMIGYSVYMGVKYHFKKPIWIWILVLGIAFLFTENVDNAERFIWPISIIGVGTWMVLKHNKRANEAQHTDTTTYKI